MRHEVFRAVKLQVVVLSGYDKVQSYKLLTFQRKLLPSPLGQQIFTLQLENAGSFETLIQWVITHETFTDKRNFYMQESAIREWCSKNCEYKCCST
jgi:hypothetical protein